MDIRASLKGPFGDEGVAIRIRGSKPGLYGRSVRMEEVPEGDYIPPVMVLDPTLTQQLMDDLYRCGFRPSEGKGSAGQLASTEKHLDDMRHIAFSTIGLIPEDIKKQRG